MGPSWLPRSNRMSCTVCDRRGVHVCRVEWLRHRRRDCFFSSLKIHNNKRGCGTVAQILAPADLAPINSLGGCGMHAKSSLQDSRLLLVPTVLCRSCRDIH